MLVLAFVFFILFYCFSALMFLASVIFALFYCFSLSFFSSSVSSWGPARLGTVSGLPLGVLSHGRFGPGGQRTLHLSVRPPVCNGWGCLHGGAICSLGLWSLSVWLAPKASSSPQASVPGHVSLGTASVCVGLSVLVCVCVHMCGSVYVFVYLSVYLLGWEGWVLLIFFSWFSLLFLICYVF